MGKLFSVLVVTVLMCNVATFMIMLQSQGGEAAELQGSRKLMGESTAEATDAKYYHGGGWYHGGGGGYHNGGGYHGGGGGYHGGGGYNHGGGGYNHGGGGYHHGGGGHP